MDPAVFTRSPTSGRLGYSQCVAAVSSGCDRERTDAEGLQSRCDRERTDAVTPESL